MKIKDVMHKKVKTISPKTTLKEAVILLMKNKISGLIVTDENTGVVGVVSEKDIYRLLYPSYEEFYQNPEIFTDFKQQETEIKNKANILVETFMSKDVTSIDPDAEVMKAGAIMLAKNINRLPVISQEKKLVGIVSRRDIYVALFKKEFKGTDFGLKLKKILKK